MEILIHNYLEESQSHEHTCSLQGKRERGERKEEEERGGER